MVLQAELRIRASTNQRRYVVAEMMGSGSYMISMGHFVAGDLDVKRLKNAFSKVVQRHDALKTSFNLEDGEIWVAINRQAEFQFHHSISEDTGLGAFREIALPLVFNNVDPTNASSLVRLVVVQYPDAWRFTVAIHHACSDGFSRGVVNRELLKCYCNEELSETNSYYDFQTSDPICPIPDELLYDQLRSFPEPVWIPGDGQLIEENDAQGKFVDLIVATEKSKLRSVSKAHGISQFGFLCALYGLGLCWLTGKTTTSTSFQSEGRSSLGAGKNVVGSFSNTLPLDLSFSLDDTFETYAQSVSSRVKNILSHESAHPFELIGEFMKTPSVSLNMFPPLSKIRAGDLDVGPREFLDRRTEFDLNLVWSEEKGALRSTAFYDARRISKDRARLFIDFQNRLMMEAVSNLGSTCKELLKQARKENRAFTSIINGNLNTLEPHKKWPSIHDAFLQQSANCPDVIAITTTSENITYADLQGKAAAYCNALTTFGVTSTDKVAILADRCPDWIAAMLGISMSGASFVVLDAKYPDDRINFMLKRLSARFLINASNTDLQNLDANNITNVELGIANKCAVSSDNKQRPFAYHMFSSGSTGTQKLISHPDATLMRFIYWQTTELGDLGEYRTGVMAGLSHDPIMRDVFLPLSTGGTVVLPTDDEMKHPSGLRELFGQKDVNVLHITPATGRLLTMGTESDYKLETIKAVFWGGDELSGSVIQPWKDCAPNARQFNLYGATETPQAALINEISSGDLRDQRVSVGQPLPWTGMRVVTADNDIADIGEIGEIVIKLSDPVKGASSGNSHSLNDQISNEHYTGDLGFVLSDAKCTIVGRKDRQIKLNSFRVDLTEIAEFAKKVAAISDARAIVTEGSSREIILFFVTVNDGLTIASIRAELERNLPNYMVPGKIINIDQIPLTLNGKVDDKRLLEAAKEDQTASITKKVHPLKTKREEWLANIFDRFTGNLATDRRISLADCGADSLSILEVRLELEKSGVDIPAGWEWMSVKDLAKIIDDNVEPIPSIPAWRRLTRIDVNIVLKTIAIIYIVANHTDDFSIAFGGGSALLFVLAGYAFGRWQLPAVLNDNKIGRILALIAKILIPLVPASILIFSVHASIGNNPHPSTLFFYENISVFVDNVVMVRGNQYHHVTWLWFLHLYLQVFVFIALMLSFSSARKFLSANLWRSSIWVFLVSDIVAVGVIYVLGNINGDMGHVSALLNRSPTTLFPLFILGTIVALAKNNRQKLIACTLISLHLLLAYTSPLHTQGIFWVTGLLAVLWIPPLILPIIVSRVVIVISAHALMIYLCHRAVDFGLRHLFGPDINKFIIVIVAIAIGVGLGFLMQPILRFLKVNRLSKL